MTDPAFEPQENAALTTEATPVPAKKRTGLIVLAIVVVLLLGTTGTLGVLYANAKSRHDAVNSQLSDKEKELQGSTKKVLDGNDAVKKAQEAERKAEDGQRKAEDEGTVRIRCQEAARALREATLVAPDRDKITNAGNRLLSSC